MPTSANQQSKPKNTICFHKLRDVRQVPTSVSGQRMPAAAGSGEGLTPSPDQIKLGPQTRALDSESSQSNKADQIEEEIKIMARFGPTYEEVEKSLAIGKLKDSAKDSAWEKFCKTSNSCMSAIRNIEDEAMKCYESSIFEKLKQRKKMFRLMMAKDGCFFLQIAIHILGGGEFLAYPDQDPYFGKDADSSLWIPDMFFVGNQIPCIVINALMEQSFFQDVIKKGVENKKWKPPVEHLAKLALYQTIVEPHLKTEKEEKEKEKKEKEKEKKEKEKEKEKKEKEKEEKEKEKKEKEKEKKEKEKEEKEKEKKEKEKEKEKEKKEKEKEEKEKEKKEKEKEKDIVSFQRKPSEILEALRNLHLGRASDNNPIYTEMKDFQDLEAGMDGKVDDKDNSIPGAGDLNKQGIKLVKGKAGITNIKFSNRGYAAFLYVPPFTVDKHTEKLLTSLANWELLHLNESERELTSYLRFMRDLARTYKDFKILEGKGIICVEDNELKRTMVQMLDTIVSGHNSNYTLNFRQIRRDIKDYGGPPWRLISFCLGVLTVVQTIFTVLSYCFPPRT